MNAYSPRRCSTRWLDTDCPKEILALLDNKGKTFDRYTVIYNDMYEYQGDKWLSYRGMSEHPQDPQGFGVSGEMKAHEVAAYRYRAKHQYTKWSTLPDDVKKCIMADVELMRNDGN